MLQEVASAAAAAAAQAVTAQMATVQARRSVDDEMSMQPATVVAPGEASPVKRLQAVPEDADAIEAAGAELVAGLRALTASTRWDGQGSDECTECREDMALARDRSSISSNSTRDRKSVV